MKFEEKLIKLRKKSLLSQEELAEKLNVTRQTVSKWELGQSKPDMDKLKELCQIFEIGIEELANDNVEVDNTNTNKPQEKKERKWLLWVLILVIVGALTVLIIRIGVQREKDEEEAKNIIGGIFNTVTNSFNSDDMFNSFNQIKDNLESTFEEESNKMEEESNKNTHNYQFESGVGTKPGMAVQSVLDSVISVNKKDKNHTVTLIYNDVTTTDDTKIKSIKHGLEKLKMYEVSVEYDDNGYVYQVILEDI